MALLMATFSDWIGRNDLIVCTLHEIASIFAKSLQLQLQQLLGLNLPEWSHHTSPIQFWTKHLPLHYFSQSCNGYENYS